MHTRRLLLVLFSVSAFVPFASAQTEAEVQTVFIEQAVVQSTTATPLTVEETYDTILDFGLSDVEVEAFTEFSLGTPGNLALVRQTGFEAAVGFNNNVVVDQSGEGNLAVLLQQGDGNFTSALQLGNGNVIGVRLRGTNNQLGSSAAPGIEQLGDDNVYLLDYTGNGQTIAPTTQMGNGNQVVQLGETAAPFGVQQYGDGMRMIIRHNGAVQ